MKEVKCEKAILIIDNGNNLILKLDSTIVESKTQCIKDYFIHFYPNRLPQPHFDNDIPYSKSKIFLEHEGYDILQNKKINFEIPDGKNDFEHHKKEGRIHIWITIGAITLRLIKEVEKKSHL